MRHPTDGVLRRLLDEPAGVADADREHVADCPVCLVGLAAAREDARGSSTGLRADRAATPTWTRPGPGSRPRLAAPSSPRGRRPPRAGPGGAPRSCAGPAAAALAVGLSWPAPASPPPTTGCRSSTPRRSPRSASRPTTSWRCPT